MAKQLRKVFDPSVDEVKQKFVVNSWHVSQSVDALTGIEDYDITISGSLTVTGSILQTGIENANGIAVDTVVRDSSTGKLYVTSSTGGGGVNTNIYSADGSLTSTRTLESDGNNLTFEFDTADFTLNSDPTQKVIISNLPTGDQAQVLSVNPSDGTIRAMDTASFVMNTDTGSFVYSGSFDSTTDTITLYSADIDYDLDLSGLAGGSGLAITASYTGSVLTENARSFNFEGNAVDATHLGNAVTVAINTSSVENIYNTDGSLTSNRTVTADGNNLTFEFETANFTINSDPNQRVIISNLPTGDQAQVLSINPSDGTIRAMNTSSIGGGGSTTPGGPLNTFQFNNSNAFSGSSLFFDSTNERVGIGESTPDHPLHITDTNDIAIRLERTDAANVGIQFYDDDSTVNGAIIRGQGNNFELVQSDSGNQRNLYVSASGETYLPRIADSNQQHLAAYDTSSGEITYITASEYNVNIYNTNGTLTNSRTLDFGGNALTFEALNGESFNIAAENSAIVGISLDNSEFEITGLANLDTAKVLGIDASGNVKAMNTSSIAGTAIDTGSFYVSSSINLEGNVITFNQGDGTTETINIDVNPGGIYDISNRSSSGPQYSTSLNTIVGSTVISSGNVNQSVRIDEIANLELGTQVHITATQYGKELVFGKKHISVYETGGGGSFPAIINANGAITFELDAAPTVDTPVMYHVIYTKEIPNP